MQETLILEKGLLIVKEDKRPTTVIPLSKIEKAAIDKNLNGLWNVVVMSGRSYHPVVHDLDEQDASDVLERIIDALQGLFVNS